jgi:hypothetical protein
VPAFEQEMRDVGEYFLAVGFQEQVMASAGVENRPLANGRRLFEETEVGACDSVVCAVEH